MRVDEFRLLLRGIPKDFDMQIWDGERGMWESDVAGKIKFVKELPLPEDQGE